MGIGLVCRSDKSGLGAQSRRLARMLNPDKIMLIDSTPFNNSHQHPEWYINYQVEQVYGFPNDLQIRHFLSGIDTIVSCETFYNTRFTQIAKDMRVKTILIANPEFFDWFKPNWVFIPRPDKIIVPSKWMKGKIDAEYLPTPIFEDEFEEARKTNLKRSGRNYLFINGKTAQHDRNGLESLYEALKLSIGEFTITIKSQNNIPFCLDKRVFYDIENPEENWKLYSGYDALILPRRYGGQSLPMSEALQSGLPVIMTDIEPNNHILPKKWLVTADKTGSFMARTQIDIYSADPQELAVILDSLDISTKAKKEAYNIGKQYDAEKLRSKYEELLK